MKTDSAGLLGRAARAVRYLRRVIEIRVEFAKQRKKQLIIGASGSRQRGWISTEVAYLNLLEPAHWRRLFRPNSIDALLAEHVWEHLTPDQARGAAETCFRYLKPGGYLRVAVPDGLHPDPEYVRRVDVGGTGPEADDHKVLYTHETLSNVFEQAGFRVVLHEYFDESGTFHFHDWDPEDGMIHRSKRFDERNQDGKLRYTSIVLDAVKD